MSKRTPAPPDNVLAEAQQQRRLLLSKQTASLVATPSPRGHSKKGNWITHSAPGPGPGSGKLANYIENVRNALIRNGHDESSATAIAVGAMHKWARGGGHVHPEVRAAASGALADWQAKKGKAAGKKAARTAKGET